jgi:magnesium transporter
MEKMEQTELDTLIEAGEWETLQQRLSDLPPAAAAHVITEAPPERRLDLFRAVNGDTAQEIFPHLSCERQQDLLEDLTESEIRRLVNALAPDDRTYLLENLSRPDVQRLLALLTIENRREAMELLQYAEDSVGRLMSPEYVALLPHWTAANAVDYMRRRRIKPEFAHTLYVVDNSSRLQRVLTLPALVLAPPSTPVTEVSDRPYVTLSPTDDRERAVRDMGEYDMVALPVTREDGVMLGVVTFDDVMDVAEEEATEDIQRQAGVEPLNTPYPDISVRSLFQKRIPWLAALIGVYLVASAVVSAFEGILAAQVVLAAFLPMLMGSGGNVGAQSGTLTVRALATGELGGRAWVRALNKEAAVGLVLGLALAVLAGSVGFWKGGPALATVIATSMLAIVCVANMFGILLPLLLQKLGVDPAVAASPVITSLTDISSLVIYFVVAKTMLNLG